ncbi:MAG: hypothetical protein K1X55_17100 [Chitinophagales bacterium]|nr:hypothetical protein [Chitinophagales bacterium]
MNNAFNTEYRFNPDGECRLCNIDFICSFIQEREYLEEIVRTNLDTRSTLEFLQKNGFNFFIWMPLISFFTKNGIKIVIQYPSITFRFKKYSAIIKSLKDQGIRYCILYHLSAYQLYKLNERWTHCVTVGCFSNITDDIIFDPLRNILESEYNGSKIFPIFTQNELDKKLGIKIIIW